MARSPSLELAALDSSHGGDVLLPPHVHPGVRLHPLLLGLLGGVGGAGGSLGLLGHERLGQGVAAQGGRLGGRVGGGDGGERGRQGVQGLCWHSKLLLLHIKLLLLWKLLLWELLLWVLLGELLLLLLLVVGELKLHVLHRHLIQRLVRMGEGISLRFKVYSGCG